MDFLMLYGWRDRMLDDGLIEGWTLGLLLVLA